MTLAITDWPKRLVRYFIDEFGFFIATILFLILDVFWCLYTFPQMGFLENWEVRIRHTGMYLEIFGLATAISGIIGTKKKLNHKGMIANLVDKLKRFPKPWRSTQYISAQGMAQGNATMTATATVIPAKANSIEERIARIESAIELQNKRIDDSNAECKKRSDAHTQALENEKQQREKSDMDNLELIDDLTAGDLHIEGMGIFWLLVGIILSTSSSELVQYVQPFIEPLLPL